MKKKVLISALFLATIVGGCTNSEPPVTEKSFYDKVETETKEISKDEYFNKTLGGLLGQFAGFLSGYEFVWDGGGLPYIGMPESWFDFLNGPYAGNYTHYYPGSYAQGNNKYDRLKKIHLGR